MSKLHTAAEKALLIRTARRLYGNDECEIDDPTEFSDPEDGSGCWVKCGATDRFRIDATATFEVTDDGTDDYQNVEWGEASPCACCHCDFDGTVADFEPGG